MESVLKVGRTFSDGMYRAAGLVARGARRILAAIPLIGYSNEDNDDESKLDKTTVSFFPPSPFECGQVFFFFDFAVFVTTEF